jgi:aldehyde:ferredoxin oxidoreductase
MLPTQNFQTTHFDQAHKLSGPAIRTSLSPLHAACHDCPIACKKTDRSNNRLPEYSALSHFGALLEIGNLRTVIDANMTCRELGLDAISAAATLATQKEITGEIPPNDDLSKKLRQISQRKKGSHLLGLGSRRLAEQLNRPEAAMTVKSLELPAFDPRGASGMALSFCTSTLGGSQIRANMEASEILRKPVAIDRFSFAGKARLLKIAEDAHAAADSLIICQHALYAASLEEYAEALNAVTGQDYTPATLSKMGENIINTELEINRCNGFSTIDDMLPERFFKENGSSGNGLQIPPLDKTAFTEELHRYYRIRNIAD